MMQKCITFLAVPFKVAFSNSVSMPLLNFGKVVLDEA
jgi:hypothetical protein